MRCTKPDLLPRGRSAAWHAKDVGTRPALASSQFLDLVERKFYDGMEIQRADGFVVQTGDPDGPATGFVENGKMRT